ncbi:hypothetical protein T552_02748 [Pneumocystis carinii B80]|uniref:DNA/RNA-binding protein Alba-like domain-containing protein n=1 Tax=Pneumocystis carinii (strain B80) TaxID=1408658 RepID=A0A0W4ZEG0_PNEC8|nr:hypothetical protein T552_02748 [Pneumocystis carinii B80]KTW26744.1 hypothetical protein T552_02748 [Pneumocystis carinii B80]
MKTPPFSTIKTDNKVYVKKSSKIRSIVSRGLYVLTEREFESTFTVEAQGLSIGKAVTIIEILKRRLRDAELSFWQYNQLDNANASMPHADSMTNNERFLNLEIGCAKDCVKNVKTKIIPVLRMKLSRIPLDLTGGWREQLNHHSSKDSSIQQIN